MQYRQLGKTGLKISRMGFGGIPIQRTNAEETQKIIRYLHENGINYIDTARGYTVSEAYLGQALEGIRQDFVLASKTYCRTKEAMAAEIDTSLKNLKTDYIDLYQVHNPTPEELDTVIGPGGALEALAEAKAAGKIGHIGITLHPVDMFARALELPWVETIMFPYNIVETQARELIHKCGQKGIGFIAMKPLAGGAIDDAALALRFVSSNPDVTVVIPGMGTVAEAQQDLAAMENTAPLTAAEQEKIAAICKSLGTQFCRRCNYCAPCTAGISIYSMFLLQGYHDRYGLKEWSKARYQAAEKKASDCVDCGICETRCPYNLPIRQMLGQVKALFEE